jgi:hypothetical protein
VLPALPPPLREADQGAVGFQRFEPTAVFEMDSANMPKTRAYFEQVWVIRRRRHPVHAALGKYNSYWTSRGCGRFTAPPSTSGSPAGRRWRARRCAMLHNPFMEAMGLAG